MWGVRTSREMVNPFPAEALGPVVKWWAVHGADPAVTFAVCGHFGFLSPELPTRHLVPPKGLAGRRPMKARASRDYVILMS
jgi:hypothetical protein